MKPVPVFLAVICALSLFSSSTEAQTAKLDRQVAVTIDDLPAGMADRMPATEITAMTAKVAGHAARSEDPRSRLRQREKALQNGRSRRAHQGSANVPRIRLRTRE